MSAGEARQNDSPRFNPKTRTGPQFDWEALTLPVWDDERQLKNVPSEPLPPISSPTLREDLFELVFDAQSDPWLPKGWTAANIDLLEFPNTPKKTTKTSSEEQKTALLARKSPFCRQGRRYTLPVIFINREDAVMAVPDYGADVDAISHDLANDLGCRIRSPPPGCKCVKLANGGLLPVVGRVTLRCSFANGFKRRFRRTFLVFRKLLDDVNLIFGRPFLDQTETFTKHRERLEERDVSQSRAPRVMKMAASKRLLPCYIDSQLEHATADMGSEVDLMQEDYAVERGFNIEPVLESERYVRLPGNTTVKLAGKVHVRFDTLHAYTSPNEEAPGGESSSDSPEKDSTEDSTASIGSLNGAAAQVHMRTFYLLPGLTTEILLGEELLDSIDAFGAHHSSFVDFETSPEDIADLNSVKWLGPRERRLTHGKKVAATWPPELEKNMDPSQPLYDLGPLEDFLGKPLDELDLQDDNHFYAALSTRRAREISRRREASQHLTSLSRKEQASTDPGEKQDLAKQRRDDADAERETQENYARDKQTCKDAWAAWRVWHTWSAAKATKPP